MIQGFLTQVEKFEEQLSEDSVLTDDDLYLLQIRVAQLYDQVALRAAARRTCPGRYWRQRASVVAAIGERSAQLKRSKFNTEDLDCPHAPGKASFARHHIGPPRERPLDGSDTRRLLCDTCGQACDRDRKQGLIVVSK